MNNRIVISFKNTTKDTELWIALQNLEEKSMTIKELLYKSLVADKEPKK